MTDSIISVKAFSENPTKTVVKVRDFEIFVDEPSRLGGTNDGPNPVEYILSGFAGCINVMGHLIAKEMNFTLKGVEINISGALNPAKYSGKETTERAGFKHINVELKPDADTDEGTLKKWLEIIESRCPVADNLYNSTPINITME